MKRFLSIFLAVMMVLGLPACGIKTQPALEEPKEQIQQTEETLSTEEAQPVDNIEEEPEPVPIEVVEPDTAPEEIPENSTFQIHFIDVGQADAALVECDGHYMLIDGGNKADSNVIYSVLQKEAVPKLDLIVGTHAHEDHIGGLPGALHYTTADQTLCPVTEYDSKAFRDFAEAAETSGGGITVPSVGDTYSLGSAEVKILGVNAGEDTNNTSIVLRIVYGATSFLFTGDAEREAEQAILNSAYAAELPSTVLKVGHHGSDTSTTYPFLRAVMPQYGVISCGKDNSYGHPTEDTLSRLRDADVTTFRTDLQGDVFCASDGTTVTFTVGRNQDMDTLADAGDGGSHAQTPTQQPQAQPTQEPSEPKPEPVPAPQPQPKEPAPVVPGTDYILNINSKKFHYPSCHSVDRMKESNKQYYNGSRDDLIAMGYSPCGNCNP